MTIYSWRLFIKDVCLDNYYSWFSGIGGTEERRHDRMLLNMDRMGAVLFLEQLKP